MFTMLRALRLRGKRPSRGVMRTVHEGPERHANVALEARDEGAVAALVDLQTGDQPVVRHVVPIKDGEIQIGRGMCGGPFQLEPGKSYTATLTLIDAAGNTTPAANKPIQFVGASPGF